jgi:hypothetical protein
VAACVFRGLDEVHEDLQRMHRLYGKRAPTRRTDDSLRKTGTAHGLGISQCVFGSQALVLGSTGQVLARARAAIKVAELIMICIC